MAFSTLEMFKVADVGLDLLAPSHRSTSILSRDEEMDGTGEAGGTSSDFFPFADVICLDNPKIISFLVVSLLLGPPPSRPETTTVEENGFQADFFTGLKGLSFDLRGFSLGFMEAGGVVLVSGVLILGRHPHPQSTAP